MRKLIAVTVAVAGLVAGCLYEPGPNGECLPGHGIRSVYGVSMCDSNYPVVIPPPTAPPPTYPTVGS